MEKSKKRNKRVLLERYKGFDIYYDKEKERIFAENPKVKLSFEARTLWEVKGHIKETQVKEVDKMAYLPTSFFGERIAKVHLLTMNDATRKYRYEILEDTDDSSDVGRTENEEITKIYEVNSYNTQIYNKVRSLAKEIKRIERQQEKLVKELR